METKKPFTKRVRRYIGAAIAAGVTTFIALEGYAQPDADMCSIHEATAWQLALTDPEMEQSPEHILEVTEAFLTACPSRPEFYEASRVAGIAAADIGNPARAAKHFRNAGAMRDHISNFYAMAALAAAGDDISAWRLRDQMIERWRTRLERHPLVSVSAEAAEQGMIYQIYFTEPDLAQGVRAAWIGVPYGPGWPATLTFSQDPFRWQLRKVRASEDIPDFRYVDLHRCQGRRALGQIATSLSVTEFDAAAHASLKAYMATPDVPPTYESGPVQSCIFPGRLLPNPPLR